MQDDLPGLFHRKGFIFGGMNKTRVDTINRMNLLGKERKPFVFLVDFEESKPLVLTFDEVKGRLFWSASESNNIRSPFTLSKKVEFEVLPGSYANYKKGFDFIRGHIHFGHSFLVNYTQPTPVKTNLSLDEIFTASHAKYKVYLAGQFTCFSPEIFVKIKDGKIFSFPMKGTIDAGIRGAETIMKNNRKELAEHYTVVDLIRNDLSMVANEVEVEKFAYIESISTNRGSLLQMSSVITGRLPRDYHEQIGTIVFKMLPAGSISGAPKTKTVEIIKEAEGYERGYYTGVFGIFDGQNLDSCVLIRYIENQNGQLVYKSGGGITYLSNCRNEYEELLKKVYVPID